VLENGRRWRLGSAGEWEALENGRRWRMGSAGEWQATAADSSLRLSSETAVSLEERRGAVSAIGDKVALLTRVQTKVEDTLDETTSGKHLCNIFVNGNAASG
jgi:hypothetical protein